MGLSSSLSRWISPLSPQTEAVMVPGPRIRPSAPLLQPLLTYLESIGDAIWPVNGVVMGTQKDSKDE